MVAPLLTDYLNILENKEYRQLYSTLDIAQINPIYQAVSTQAPCFN